MIRTSLHNHSNWSDGDADMATMIRAAKAAGLREFGLSDHYVATPFDDTTSIEWSMPLERIDDYITSLLEFKKIYDDENFTLRIGLEVDYFEDNAFEVMAKLNEYPLDYVIGSVHYAVRFPVDHAASNWQALDQFHINQVWHDYWRRLAGLCSSQLYDIVGHLDLPKKFNYFPTYDYLDEAETVLREVRNSSMLMELNTAGWSKACRNCYPGEILLMRAYQLNIPVIISADAHNPAQLLRDFDKADEALANAGYEPQVWSFNQRKRTQIL